ncbi:MAG: DUF3313 domain-containing protein [Gammaproteobacteria bacterium]|nr:DUF3313 domain-containing protein [Gammaproteobacteria bacterium]
MKAIRKISSILAVLSAIAIGSGAVAAEPLPETSPEGLVLMKDTKLKIVYVRPGATLDPYTKVILLDCYVAFRKDWQKDKNREAISLSGQVKTSDMEKIKKKVADGFREIFTEELQTKGGYAIVDQPGDDVLIVRPAIMNLDITAPDIKSSSMTRGVVASAGQMTLFMELYDSSTGDIIARVIDPQGADRGGFAMMASSVTNTVEATRIIRKWAETLRSHLGELDKAVTEEDSAPN